MCELNDKKLEQVAGGACYAFDVLWREYQKKNCGGCKSDNVTDCETMMKHLRGYLDRAMTLGITTEAPSCYYKK